MTSSNLVNLAKKAICAVACVGFMTTAASADVTLAVDFTAADNDGQSALQQASIGDFAAQDSAIDLGAAVNFINGDGGGGFNQVGNSLAITGTATGGAAPGAISSSVTIATLTDILSLIHI